MQSSPDVVSAQPASSPDLNPADRFLATLKRRTTLWILLVLILEVALFSVLLPAETFLSVFNGRTILSDAAVLLILGAAATLVIIAGGIDLSLGSVMTLSAVVAGKIMADVGGSQGTEHEIATIATGVGAGAVVGCGWGAINGILIAKVRVPAFIVTLGSLGAALGVARLLSEGISVGQNPPSLQADFGQAEWLGIPSPFLIGCGVILVAGFVLAKTRFGEHLYMIGSNEEAARRGGIPIDRRVITVYAVSGLLAGLAGFVDLARFDVASVATGHITELIAAIAAVILGGASFFGGSGKMTGTVIGVFIPVVLANGLLIGGIERFWQEVIIGVILIMAVAFDQWRRDRQLQAPA
jgi:ribose transport system permease protein